jgi:hypothetical protein
MRSDEEIRADVAKRFAVPDFDGWQDVVVRLADDVPGLLARAVAAETEADEWEDHVARAGEYIDKLTDQNTALRAAVAKVRELCDEVETAVRQAWSPMQCLRFAADVRAALAGAAPEGDPPPQRCPDCDTNQCYTPCTAAERQARAAAVVQATPEQDTQR